MPYLDKDAEKPYNTCWLVFGLDRGWRKQVIVNYSDLNHVMINGYFGKFGIVAKTNEAITTFIKYGTCATRCINPFVIEVCVLLGCDCEMRFYLFVKRMMWRRKQDSLADVKYCKYS